MSNDPSRLDRHPTPEGSAAPPDRWESVGDACRRWGNQGVRRSSIFRLVVSISVTLLALAAISPANAQESSSGVVIQQADATTNDLLKVSFLAGGEGPVSVGLAADGSDSGDGVPLQPLADPRLILVVDDSVSGSGPDGFATVLGASEAAIEPFDPAQVTLIAASSPARVLDGGMDDLSSTDAPPAMWDALKIAADLSASQGATPIVAISASTDSASVSSASAARGALSASGAPVFLVATPAAERGLDAVGRIGLSRVSNGPDAAEAAGGFAERSARQFIATFPTDRLGDVASVQLAVDGERFGVRNAPGAVLRGRQAVPAETLTAGDGLPGFVKWLAAGLLALAVATLAYVAVSASVREDTALASAMRTYDTPVDELEDEDGGLATGALIQRAVEMTGDLAERRGLLARVEEALDEARLALRPAEALFFTLVAAVFAAMFGFLFFGPLGALGLFIVGLVGPVMFLKWKAKRRRDKFRAQLPDMLTLLSSTLKAGYSLGQGMDAVSKEIDEPMGAELRRAVAEAQLGRPIDEALESVSVRMKSDDFTWAVMAIKIQKEVGGNLAELLLTVAETMTLRGRLLGEVKALTAEGRVSAYVISLLPPGLGVVMYGINPGYVSTMFENRGGQIALVIGVIWATFGFFWMQKIVNIEV